jgi:excisionase family DNA binding protein
MKAQKGTEALLSDGLMTVNEACEWLGFGRTRVYQLMSSGELVYVKIGNSRRVPKRALVELAAKGLVQCDG